MPAECCKKFWKKIPDEVPVFTVVGWDKLAIRTVRCWCALALQEGVNMAKVQKGIDHVGWMEEYAALHPDAMKLPD
jgi:hypothetical protein